MAFTNLFLTKISSTIYYSTISEAITTFIIMSVSTFLTLFTVIHTIYKFFCEKLDIGELAGESSPEPETFRGRSNSATRSHLPRSRGGSFQHKAQHSKEISFLIAALTMCYLLSASLYTFSNWLIRLLMIFFSVDISCYVLAYIQIGYVLIKLSFYVLFIARLHLTFSGTTLAVKPIILQIICVASIILLSLACIFFLMEMELQFKAAGYDCSSNENMNYIRPLLPGVIVDTTTSIVLLYLFILKLSQLIRVQTSSMTSFDGYDKHALERIKNLVLVMTKLTVLVCVYIIGNWLILFLFLPLLPGAAVMIEIILGTICVIFCYEFHQSLYDKYCFLCKFLCFHTCFWWFIICKEESDAIRKMQCRYICCPENLKAKKYGKKEKRNNEVELDTKETNKSQKVHKEAQKTEEKEVEKDDGIEAMMMSAISIRKGNNSSEQNKDNIENIMAPKVEMHKVPSVEIDDHTAVDLKDITHEKTSTFIINLNVEDNIFKKDKENNSDRIEEEDEDEENMEIKKSETNVFDHRAERLLEMHRLFFDPTFGENYRARKTKKEEERNRKLFGKKFETDFKVYDDDDDKKEKKIDHQVKKSKTSAY